MCCSPPRGIGVELVLLPDFGLDSWFPRDSASYLIMSAGKTVIFSSLLHALRVNMAIALGSQSFLPVLDGLSC